MRMVKGTLFLGTEAEFAPEGNGARTPPTFSEAFLYPTVGKGDARFILGVADEYDHLIRALGPKAVKAILDVKPRLAQRLNLGQSVVEWLEDARSDESLRREEISPSEATLDADAAHAVWKMLHDEYRRFFNPQESMPREQLQAYEALTDALGRWAQQEKEAADERRPALVEHGKKANAIRATRREAATALQVALRNDEGVDDALGRYKEVFG